MSAGSGAVRICFVYVWATSGGVERVFLNRAEALLPRYPALEIDVYFYEDYGGVALFKRYLKARGLDRIQVVSVFEPARYDYVFAVDTPQVLNQERLPPGGLFIECHTPYPENRAYLRQCQDRLDKVIVPSEAFRRQLEAEVPLLRERIHVLRNFVPSLPDAEASLVLPDWRLPPFVYLGRIDELKNFSEFVEGLSRLRRLLPQPPLGIAIGQVVPGYPWQEVIRKHGAEGSVVLLPPVPFEKSHILMRLLREKRAVYVSCSKGESFGLSVAEAMSAGLPVVLSDIAPHADLVADRAKFLYALGDIDQLSRKMQTAMENYDTLSAECRQLARAFSEDAFIEDWNRLLDCCPRMLTVAKTPAPETPPSRRA